MKTWIIKKDLCPAFFLIHLIKTKMRNRLSHDLPDIQSPLYYPDILYLYIPFGIQSFHRLYQVQNIWFLEVPF